MESHPSKNEGWGTADFAGVSEVDGLFKPNAHSKPYTLKQVDFFCGVRDSGGCLVPDSGGGVVAWEAQEGVDDLAGEAEASGAVQV